MQSLTNLTVEGNERDSPALAITEEIASAICRLPHLAKLQLRDCHCPPRSRQILSSSESLAWVWLDCDDDFDIQKYRADRAPKRFPPVYEDLELPFGDW